MKNKDLAKIISVLSFGILVILTIGLASFMALMLILYVL